MSKISDSPIQEESPFAKEEVGIYSNVMEILSKRKDLFGKTIFDIACGDGRTTYFLRKLGLNVHPYDLLPEKYKLDDTPRYVDVQTRFEIEDKVADFVIFQEVIEHLPNQLFTLKELHRILKDGGEVFLTTPSKSCIASKLSYLFFESETKRIPPWGASNSIWGEDKASGKVYYGHVWLLGIQQLRTMALLSGFKDVKFIRSELSKTSIFFLPFLYLPILLVSWRATRRYLKKAKNEKQRQEVMTQFKENINPKNLLSKFLIAYLVK